MVGHFFVLRVSPLLVVVANRDPVPLPSPLDLTKSDAYRNFLDNHLVSQHQSIVYGLRELSATETQQFCSNTSTVATWPKTFDTPSNFSSNYELRAYTSGCYYLDSDNNWQSDGLTVSTCSLPFLPIIIHRLPGWATDRSHPNAVFLHSLDHVCRWFPCLTSACELELRVR